MLTVLIVLDTITGTTRAWMNKDLSSRTMKDGITRNGSVLLVVWTLHFITPEDFYIPMSIIITGFIASNLISIFENLHGMGVEIPYSILEKLRDFNDKTNGKREDRHDN